MSNTSDGSKYYNKTNSVESIFKRRKPKVHQNLESNMPVVKEDEDENNQSIVMKPKSK